MNRVIDDLISRTEAKDFVRSERGAELLKHFPLNAIIVLKLLDEIPSINTTQGRWIKMTGMMPPEYHGHYECSECGWHMKGLRNSWTREEEMSYCPNCGAKMETKSE